MIRVIEDRGAQEAYCPLGHPWDATVQIVDKGWIAHEGRRPHRRIEHAVVPERCPECGNRWCTYVSLERTR